MAICVCRGQPCGRLRTWRAAEAGAASPDCNDDERRASRAQRRRARHDGGPVGRRSTVRARPSVVSAASFAEAAGSKATPRSATSRVGFAEAVLGRCAVLQPRVQMSIAALMKRRRLVAAARQIDVRALPMAAAGGTAMRGPGQRFARAIVELAADVLGGRSRACAPSIVRAAAAKADPSRLPVSSSRVIMWSPYNGPLQRTGSSGFARCSRR
jgi:hypothetical protein